MGTLHNLPLKAIVYAVSSLKRPAMIVVFFAANSRWTDVPTEYVVCVYLSDILYQMAPNLSKNLPPDQASSTSSSPSTSITLLTH